MCITKKSNFHDIMDYINHRLIPREREKKKNGEVFTPLELINGIVPNLRGGTRDEKLEVSDKKKLGMLDHLPKEVWTNPHLKWLDPANGIGNFPICIHRVQFHHIKHIINDMSTSVHFFF